MKTENKIDLLKRKLDLLIANNAPYEDVFRLSSKIDKLLVKIYSGNVGSGQSCEKSKIPSTTTSA